MTERPKVGIGVFVVNNDKIILQKRKGAHGAGEWSLPGGHLEFGESWEDAAAREVLEETGLKIKNIKFVGVTNDIFEKERLHYITIFMQGETDETNLVLKEPEKAEEIDWFELNNLPEPFFTPLKNFLNTEKFEIS